MLPDLPVVAAHTYDTPYEPRTYYEPPPPRYEEYDDAHRRDSGVYDTIAEALPPAPPPPLGEGGERGGEGREGRGGRGEGRGGGEGREVRGEDGAGEGGGKCAGGRHVIT